MKILNFKSKIVLAALTLFLGAQAAFAKDVSIGGALGMRTHDESGSIYTESVLEGDAFIDWEKFGLKFFVDFSFYTNESSSFTNNVVSYNKKTTSTKEGLGVAPYYIFKNTDKVKLFAGPLLSFSFYQDTTNYDYVSATTTDNEYKTNYMLAEIGLFIGTRVSATEKLSLFFEVPMTARLAQKYFSYKKNGSEIDDYKNFGFGTGGGNSFRTYFTPKLGVIYKF